MCEHKWITTRAVYRTSTTDGYKNHEINRRVCINCLKTKDEIELEQQLSAANARIAGHAAKCETCFGNYAKAIGKLTERAEAAIAIANAPTDIEALLAEVRQLQVECKRREYCGSCSNYGEAYRNDFCRVKGPHIPIKRQYHCDIGMWTDKHEPVPEWR